MKAPGHGRLIKRPFIMRYKENYCNAATRIARRRRLRTRAHRNCTRSRAGRPCVRARCLYAYGSCSANSEGPPTVFIHRARLSARAYICACASVRAPKRDAFKMAFAGRTSLDPLLPFIVVVVVQIVTVA